MAALLQRLGLASARHKALVMVIWLLALAGAGTAAVTLAGPTSTSFSIPGAESSQALEVVGQKFPQIQASGATVQVVMVAPPGSVINDPQNAAAVVGAAKALSAADGVANASNPFDERQPVVSQDRTTALSTVTFDKAQGNVTKASLDAVQQAVDAARTAGLDVKIGGNAFQQVPEIIGPGEIGGVIVAFIVLMLTYGALAAAGANLLTALVGVGIGAAGITALSGLVDLQATTSILAVMLGLAVGIDYALFIFARFRSERLEGNSVVDSVGRATGTAGSAVVVAGLTVVIALAGLSVVGIPFLAEMGLAAAATVVIAVLVALTLVPALLAAMGDRSLRKKYRAILAAGGVVSVHQPDSAPDTGRDASDTAADGADAAPAAKRGFLHRVSDGITRRPTIAAIGAVVLLGVIAAPVLSLKTSLPDSGTADPASQQRQAYDLIAQKFGPGLAGPLLILVEGPNGPAQAGAVSQRIKGGGDVAFAAPPQPSADGSAALFTVIPFSGPHDVATEQLVTRVRAMDFGAGVEVRVTGTTAVSIDVDSTLSGALPIYLAVVVGLALILLLLVFRSILVPVTATLGFLLSYGAALGATTAIFQWGWLATVFGVVQPAPLMSLLPIIVIGILFGLAMDYQVFLVSRIHEAHAHGEDPVAAVRHGFRRSAPVVVAAASIMAAVFGGFVGSGDPMIKAIAFALTVGVLFDAFVVRMVLIPAVLTLLRGSAWWLPRWLERALPHIDVEGSAIEKTAPTTVGSPVLVGAGRHEANAVASPSDHTSQHGA